MGQSDRHVPVDGSVQDLTQEKCDGFGFRGDFHSAYPRDYRGLHEQSVLTVGQLW